MSPFGFTGSVDGPVAGRVARERPVEGYGHVDRTPGGCPSTSPFAASSAATNRPSTPFHGPAPDPFSDPDTIEDLGDRIATLAAHIHAAEQRFLLLLAEFDWRRGWELAGHRSCVEWLSLRTGFDAGTCRERVRVARKLAGLPETTAAMGRGELSFSQVRALTRVATPENEGVLLELARGVPTGKLESLIRGWKRGTVCQEMDRERECFDSRRLSVFPDEEGMYVVNGKLTPEVGLLLMRAIDGAGDHLFREEVKVLGRDLRDPEVTRQEAARRRADALGLLAGRALAVGFGPSAREDAPDPGNGDAPISGSQAERYQVVLHVDPEALETASNAGVDGEPADCCHLDDGTRVSAETARRIACDAGLVRMSHDEEGQPLSVGRKTRTIPPAIRRALDARDGGCRFPGCGVRRFTAGHHVKHWAHGGETKLDNLLLLCRHHHRLVHEGGWSVRWQSRGNPLFIDPRGGIHFNGRWRLPAIDGVEDRVEDGVEDGATSGVADRAKNGAVDRVKNRVVPRVVDPVVDAAVETLRLDNQTTNGAHPDGWTCSARWKRDRDIPPEVYFPAIEALGEALS